MESYECRICHKKYNRLLYKESCEQSHGIIYIPVFKEDVVKLLEFVYHAYIFADVEKEVPTRFMKTLQKIIALADDKEVMELDLSDMPQRDTE